MNRLMRFIAVAFLAAFLLPGNVFAQSSVSIPAQRRTDVISVSGSTATIPNPSGVLLPVFGYKITGSPSGASIVIQGCMNGDNKDDHSNCTTLETDTSTTAKQTHNPNTNQISYDYFLVTPTFTGGTSPTLVINSTLSPNARNGGSGGGGAWGSITGTLSAQTDLTSALNAKIASAPSGDQTISGTHTLTLSGTGGGAVTASTLGAGGSGYHVGDTGFLTPLFSEDVPLYMVDSVDGGGAVLTYHLTYGGLGCFTQNGVETHIDAGTGDGNFTINVTAVSSRPSILVDDGVNPIGMIGGLITGVSDLIGIGGAGGTIGMYISVNDPTVPNGFNFTPDGGAGEGHGGAIDHQSGATIQMGPSGAIKFGTAHNTANADLFANSLTLGSSLKLPGSSSGTATIVAPAAAGTPTLTLPAVTSTLASLVATPSTASTACTANSIAYDATHIYVCVNTNTWVRATLATF